jgi:hypothetical protein
MSSFQLIVLGAMLAWTPSAIVLAFLVWRVEKGSEREPTKDKSVQFDQPRLIRSKDVGDMPSLYVEGAPVQPRAHQRDHEVQGTNEEETDPQRRPAR